MLNKKGKVCTGALIVLIQAFMFFSTALAKSDANMELKTDSIYSLMKRVADWQWQDLDKRGWRMPKTDWTNGAMYAGMFTWAGLTEDDYYYKKLISIGEDNKWKIGPRRQFADDYCIGQTYSLLYGVYNRPEFIADFKKLADSIVSLPHDESLEWKNQIFYREWAWCDALFMGPPALGYLSQVTGDPKYLNKASELWWKTSDYLYSKDDHMFFRDSRYFNRKEKNGSKVFWSRGNGWVMGGIVRLLSVMPKDHKDRLKFENQLKEMAKKVSSLQQPDGSWHASLLDPQSYPVKETSGTGFFCYALAWGINEGLLAKKEYLPVVQRAWKALSSSVHPDGKLGYVQPQGAAPEKVGYDDTDVYGVGAFLLAGNEMLKLSLSDRSKLINVKNPTSLFRGSATVELKWSEIESINKTIQPAELAVKDVYTGKRLVMQVLYDSKKKPQSLLFQTEFNPYSERYFAIEKAAPVNFPSKVYGRQVPERFDDFAWENDKIAFRMYGAALDSRKDNAKGIDVWSKSTDKLVLNEWYKNNDYHVDHGEGVDAYHVGITLGAGNSAPIKDTAIYFPANYQSYKILADGPIRFSVQLFYKPWKVGKAKVEHLKTISLDAGSYMNRIVDEYKGKGDSFKIATGITKHSNDGSVFMDGQKRIIAYWDKADGKVDNGMIGVGVIQPESQSFVTDKLNHLMLVNDDMRFVSYQGGAWSKGRDFPSFEDFINYLKKEEQKLKNPLVITIR